MTRPVGPSTPIVSPFSWVDDLLSSLQGERSGLAGPEQIHFVDAAIGTYEPPLAWMRLEALHHRALDQETPAGLKSYLSRARYGIRRGRRAHLQASWRACLENVGGMNIPQAINAYFWGTVFVLGQMGFLPPRARLAVFASVRQYVQQRKTITGLEGIFMTGLSAAYAVDPLKGLTATGVRTLGKVGRPTGVGAGLPFAPVLDTRVARISPLTPEGLLNAHSLAGRSGGSIPSMEVFLGLSGGPPPMLGMAAKASQYGIDWEAGHTNLCQNGMRVAGGFVGGWATAGNPLGILTGIAGGDTLGGYFCPDIAAWLLESESPAEDDSGPAPNDGGEPGGDGSTPDNGAAPGAPSGGTPVTDPATPTAGNAGAPSGGTPVTPGDDDDDDAGAGTGGDTTKYPAPDAVESSALPDEWARLDVIMDGWWKGSPKNDPRPVGNHLIRWPPGHNPGTVLPQQEAVSLWCDSSMPLIATNKCPTGPGVKSLAVSGPAGTSLLGLPRLSADGKTLEDAGFMSGAFSDLHQPRLPGLRGIVSRTVERTIGTITGLLNLDR